MYSSVLNILSEMKEGDAALISGNPFFLAPPPITQPVLALGLSLRGWMLEPLNLYVGPPLFLWRLWAFLMGFAVYFNMVVKCLEIFWNLWCMRAFGGPLTTSVVLHRGSLAPPEF